MVDDDNLILELIDETQILGKKINLYNSIENPLFEAQDVANWLGIKNVSQMLKQADVPDNEKGIFLKYTLGGNQRSLFISEDAMYDVLMTSRKQEAKPLRREIKLYLKQIRLTGGYIPVEEDDDEKVILAKAMKILQRTLDEKDELIKMQQPKVDAYDRLCDSEKSHDMKDAAKILNFGRNTLFKKLRNDGFLMCDNTPYQRYVKQGLFKERLRPTTFGQMYHVTLMTEKGITYFDSLFNSSKAVTQ